MKFNTQLLALCLLQGTTAFLAPAPRALTLKIQTSSLRAYSYLANAESSDGDRKVALETAASSPPIVKSEAKKTKLSAAPAVTSASLKKDNRSAGTASMQSAKNIWDETTPVIVQGGSLRTWSFPDPNVERVQVLMKTAGRPLNADIDLWEGPDNTPQKMRVYIEDGNERPFSAVIETPRTCKNTVAIRNTGELEFPLSALVEDGTNGLQDATERLADMSIPETIQGGALKTYSFAPSVSSVQILLKTDSRPLNARIELLQGPNNDKQIIQVYTEDGLERPFYLVIETPGVGNVVRCVNTAPVEFPMTACVEPYTVEPGQNGPVVSSTGGTGAPNFFVTGGR